MKKSVFTTIAVFSILIGLYPIIYLVLEPNLTFLNNKPPEVLSNVIWKIAFYMHIFTGGIALLIGWVQFSNSIRQKHILLHRNLGKLYVIKALVSSVSAIYIGFFALGGPIAALGFIILGTIWLYSTLIGFIAIKNNNINKHKQFMTYSYAACFAAVTLRIWLFLLLLFIKDYVCAYIISAWLCWIPNMIVARYIIKRNN